MSIQTAPVVEGVQTTSVTDEVRGWLAEHWHGVDDDQWKKDLAESGWSAPSWPAEAHGRGLSLSEEQTVIAEFGAVGAPGAATNLSPTVALAGATVVRWGPQAARDAILPKLLSGEWKRGCLLYSEPGNGSDLAGLQTKAERDGDVFVVNGQKIWTTGGREATNAILLARTDWDVPKHAGISLFVIPMDLPGIEVRPIKQMTGDSEFNEVFLTDVRVPEQYLIGELNNGWKVLQTALMEERRMMGYSIAVEPQGGSTKPAIYSDSDDLVEAARRAGVIDDPVVRQEIMRIHTWRLANSWNAIRAQQELAAGSSSSLASLGKLAKSRILHSTWALRHRLIGTRGLLYDPADEEAFHVEHELMFSFINSIGGGSDQIQRNIISERILGLPKGYEPDRGVPFRDVLKGTAIRSVS